MLFRSKSKIIKCIWAASMVGALCTLQEALWCSIDALHAWLDMYDLEVWSILCERDTCAALVKELEEVLEAEELMDEEVELRQEKVQYDVKRSAVVRQEVVIKEHKDEGKGEGKGEGDKEEEDDEDDPVHPSGLLAKAKGKCPMK